MSNKVAAMYNIITIKVKHYNRKKLFQNLYKQNATLLGEICKEETPKLCPRSLISKGARPCSPTGKI